jgi:hypothetical protein
MAPSITETLEPTAFPRNAPLARPTTRGLAREWSRYRDPGRRPFTGRDACLWFLFKALLKADWETVGLAWLPGLRIRKPEKSLPERVDEQDEV